MAMRSAWGDNIYLSDGKGVRTPMQRSMDRNAGFSHASMPPLCFPVILESRRILAMRPR